MLMLVITINFVVKKGIIQMMTNEVLPGKAGGECVVRTLISVGNLQPYVLVGQWKYCINFI